MVKVAKFMVLWIGEKKGGYLLKFQQRGLTEQTKEITLSDSVNTTYDGKYLIILDTNIDNKEILNITLKDFNKKQGYQSETKQIFGKLNKRF